MDLIKLCKNDQYKLKNRVKLEKFEIKNYESLRESDAILAKKIEMNNYEISQSLNSVVNDCKVFLI